MDERKTIVEYGVPIDPSAMIEPPDAAELELEPGHPGLGDAAYVGGARSCSRCAGATGSNGSGRRCIEYTPRRRASGER